MHILTYFAKHVSLSTVVLIKLAVCYYNVAVVKLCCSVGTVLFTALGISCAAIGLHGALRQPDDLFTDEAEVS